MAVSKRLRYEVLRRDNHACRYCGATAPDVKLTVDHVVPQALGGSDDPTNLVTACEPCNSGKTSVPADAAIVADVEKDALRWAAAMDKAAELARAKYETRLDYRNAFRDAWDGWKTGPEHNQQSVPLDGNWETSLDNFYEAGLPEWELSEAVRAAMANQKVVPANTFRYFAGICWTKIRQMQDQAREIIDAAQTRAGRVAGKEAVDEIVDRWLAAYQTRCKEKDIDCSNVSSERTREVVAALLEQGYSESRVSAAAAKAGAGLGVHVAEYLAGSWGDFTFDAMTAWVNAWASADPENQRWRSSVPPPGAWADFKVELRGAIAAGISDELILEACKTAGELQEGLMVRLPDWEGRWEALYP
jgi:hypothetical protein